MRSIRFAAFASLAAAVLVAISAAGCGKKTSKLFFPNQRPEVRFTAAPVDTSGSYFYAYRMNWVGFDPDGRVDHFLYAVDPPASGDTAWTETTRNEQTIFFYSRNPNKDTGKATEYHVFVLKAVDNSGDASTSASPVVARAFFSFTQAPTVKINAPRPSHLLDRLVTPSTRIAWSGTDVDGQLTQKPIKYKYRLLRPGDEFPIDLAKSKPDSLRSFYAPTFAGWDSTTAETTNVQFTNLTPNAAYLFVVVAFDEAGAYSPIFSLDENMLSMVVTFANTSGPKLSLFNEFFFYQYPSGGWNPSPAAEIPLEVPGYSPGSTNPAQYQPIVFIWFAEPPPGSEIRWYRWSLDNLDLRDDTPRSDERLDTAHWSAKSSNTNFALVGPFPGGQVHKFYVEVEDNNSLRSLGIVRFTTVSPTFDKPLLLVDDTRLQPDHLSGGVWQAPTGIWPTSAELDTFLLAVGGTQWHNQFTPNTPGPYPAGTITTPGLFAGYRFDTLGTRTGKLDITIPLSTLGRYQHIVWYVDGKGALNGNGQESPTDPLRPPNALRFMSAPGRSSTLSAWARQGGLAWVLGGAAGYSSMIPWDLGGNNSIYGTVFGGFGFVQPRPELAPGRFMYDFSHWRTEFSVYKVECDIFKSWRAPGNGDHTYTCVGGQDTIRARPLWTDVPAGMSPMPDYSALPPVLQVKEMGTPDPVPPLRQAFQFYLRESDLEFLSRTNDILENIAAPGDEDNFISTLDTLYSAGGGVLPAIPSHDPCPPTGYDADHFDNPVMTYYHGRDCPPVVFSGFNIWFYKRSQCIALIDFVLQDIWHLSRANVPRGETFVARGAQPLPSPARPVAGRPATTDWHRLLQTSGRPRD